MNKTPPAGAKRRPRLSRSARAAVARDAATRYTSAALKTCATALAPHDAALRHDDDSRRNTIIAACSRYARGCSGERITSEVEQQARVAELGSWSSSTLIALCLTVAIRPAAVTRCARVNARDDDGDTAFSVAAVNEHYETMKLLVEVR